jgi:hypothetical protein
MITIRVCTRIAVAPEVVWAAVEHVERHVEWMRDAEAITFRTEAHAGVGAAFDCRTRVGPIRVDDHFVVTRWEPGVAMGIAHRGAVRGDGEFALASDAPDGSVTRFCWEERLRFPWWMGGQTGARAAQPVLRRVWQGNLARLKSSIEAPRR